jgi:hypothetical protein
VGIPEGKRRLGRSRHSWENNFKMDLQEVVWEDMDLIEMAQDRDRSVFMRTLALRTIPLYREHIYLRKYLTSTLKMVATTFFSSFFQD